MIVAVLQARASSSRLPGKVLKSLAGAPMLARQIERIARAKRFERLVVATSDRGDDDPVAAIARASGAEVFRGSLDDVLDRFYRAAAVHRPDYVVRLTGDCPLADWEVIDTAIAFAVEGDFDYASNTLRPTWPDGLDVEVAKFAALQAAWKEAVEPSEREHVMPFLTRRPDRFRLGSLEAAVDRSGLRWTVDEAADYTLAAAIYDALYPGNHAFTTADVLGLLDRRPELAQLNSGLERNAALNAARD